MLWRGTRAPVLERRRAIVMMPPRECHRQPPVSAVSYCGAASIRHRGRANFDVLRNAYRGPVSMLGLFPWWDFGEAF
jgi:hypothetical protein